MMANFQGSMDGRCSRRFLFNSYCYLCLVPCQRVLSQKKHPQQDVPNWLGPAQQYHLDPELGTRASQLFTSPLHTVPIMRCYHGQLVVQEWPVSRQMVNLKVNVFIVSHRSRPNSEQPPILPYRLAAVQPNLYPRWQNWLNIYTEYIMKYWLNLYLFNFGLSMLYVKERA